MSTATQQVGQRPGRDDDSGVRVQHHRDGHAGQLEHRSQQALDQDRRAHRAERPGRCRHHVVRRCERHRHREHHDDGHAVAGVAGVAAHDQVLERDGDREQHQAGQRRGGDHRDQRGQQHVRSGRSCSPGRSRPRARRREGSAPDKWWTIPTSAPSRASDSTRMNNDVAVNTTPASSLPMPARDDRDDHEAQNRGRDRTEHVHCAAPGYSGYGIRRSRASGSADTLDTARFTLASIPVASAAGPADPRITATLVTDVANCRGDFRLSSMT